MPYTIQAFIGEYTSLKKVTEPYGDTVMLPQGKGLFPLTDGILNAYSIPFLPFIDEGMNFVPSTLAMWGQQFSSLGVVAYIEAEFFGGEGIQASLVWNHSSIIQPPLIAENAINAALRLLGVTIETDCDEFETIGLGCHRDTNEWIRTP